MKKIFLTAGIIMMAATATFAYNNIDGNDRKKEKIEKREARKELRRESNNEVSEFTINRFSKDFPDVTNVVFEKTKNFDEVSFTTGNENLTAFYDYSGELVGTIQEKTFTDLPGNAQNKILEKYAGYIIGPVIKFDDNESNDTDMIMFGTPFDDADNYFVELKNDSKTIVVKVDLPGDVSYFTDIK